MARFWTTLLASLVVATALAGTACSHKKKGSDESSSQKELPALVISDDTPNLMLTWIDPHGDTHVAPKPSAVPNDAKRLVRVLISGNDAGTLDPIYVADLTSPSADGTYMTREMSRQDWEEEIERRRGARVASLPDEERGVPFIPAPLPGPRAPRDPHDLGPGPGHAPDLPDVPDLGDPAHPRDNMKNVGIVIYGASWCGPCHMAMKHLDQRHIAYTFKDIDKDAGASSEMNAKLARNHLTGGSIPVIDVGGRLLIGFDAGQLDRALDQTSGGTML